MPEGDMCIFLVVQHCTSEAKPHAKAKTEAAYTRQTLQKTVWHCICHVLLVLPSAWIKNSDTMFGLHAASIDA